VGNIEPIGAVSAQRGETWRTALAAALVDAREYTRRAYAHLASSDPVFPRLAIVNPARWELGHIAWFQEYWCMRHGIAWRAGDPASCPVPSRFPHADALFDSARVPHDARWSLPLPAWRGIDRYLDETLAATLDGLATCDDGARYFHELALHHEDMHGEALLMTLQTLGFAPPDGLEPPRVGTGAGDAGDIAVPGGVRTLGSAAQVARDRFVFDNEQDAHDVSIAPFAIARTCVTEGEYAAFVDAGGYRRDELWSSAGRYWRHGAGATLPVAWRQSGAGFEVRWFDRWRALAPAAAMQHVNAHEAAAYCAWARRRLPTEAEWETAAALVTDERDAANLDARLGGPVAAASTATGSNFLGNVWEWTASPFAPYPGFVAGPYAEYSQPWFGDHHVIRGGSWATRKRLVHARMRNFYRPERHDMFVGFRTCAAG
jgi:iron(II)-dependent oxidoreductase